VNDTSHLSEAERLARRVLYDADDNELDTLATLAMTVHLVMTRTVSPESRALIHDVLRRVAPDLLLTLRALEHAGQPIARRKRSILRRNPA